MDTAVERPFADGVYRFFLPVQKWLEVERKCGGADRDGIHHSKSLHAIHEQLGHGIGIDREKEIVGYMGGGAALLGDIREVLRCALIGGNQGRVNGEDIEVGPQKALELIDAYTYPHRPIIEAQYLAWYILEEAITGIQLKKKAANSAPEPVKATRKARSSRIAAPSD